MQCNLIVGSATLEMLLDVQVVLILVSLPLRLATRSNLRPKAMPRPQLRLTQRVLRSRVLEERSNSNYD